MFIATLSFYRKMTKQRSKNIATSILSLIPDNIKVLDFGCGNGYMAEFILTQKQGLEITGIDIIKDQNLDKSILGNSRFKFKINTPDQPLPFSDNTFDMVYASASMHHTKSPEFYLKEFKRVVKKEGSIILIEEMYLNLFDKICISTQDWLFNKMKKRVPVPLQFRSLKHYLQEFKNNGLEVGYQSSVRPIFPYVHHYIFKLTTPILSYASPKP